MTQALLVALTLVAFSHALTGYEEAQVLRCMLTPELHQNFHAVIEDQHALDVWGHHATGEVDIMVRNAEETKIVLDYFGNPELCSVSVPSVQAQLDEFAVEQALSQTNGSWFDTHKFGDPQWWTKYHNLQESLDWWRQFSILYPSNVQWVASIAKSFNGVDIPAIKFTFSSPNAPWIYFQCLIHSREWVSGTTCQYIVDSWVTEALAGTGPLKQYRLAVVPVVNVDGYAWTWAAGGDRLWRKNRRNCNTNPNCCGVDCNRNYPFQWGTGGSSTNPCSETYMGTSGGSEPEVQGTMNFFNTLTGSSGQPTVYLAIDWHSYSQLILRPWGYANTLPANNARMDEISRGYASAVKNTFSVPAQQRTYTPQRSYELYQASGIAVDYFFSLTTPWNGRVASFTIELRPANNPPGFVLPAEEIVPCGKENYNGTQVFVDDITSRGPLPLRN